MESPIKATTFWSVDWEKPLEVDTEELTDDEITGFYLLQWLADLDYDEERLVRDRNYARQAVMQEEP